MNTLEQQRVIIDRIDAQMIELLAVRMQAVQGVIAAKKQTGQQALQPARWEEVVKKVRALAVQKELDPDVVESIWDIMHEYFLTIEKKELK